MDKVQTIYNIMSRRDIDLISALAEAELAPRTTLIQLLT
jgi:hypothetical protein